MQQIDHRVIKLLVGLIAVSMALFLQAISGALLHSISESYYYRGRDWFVGLLFAIAVLFLSFKGNTRTERRLTLLAGVLSTVVATAPCECGRPHSAISALHFPAAGILFAILGYFCWRFRQTALSKVARYAEAAHRVHVYTACLAGMLVCAGMALAYAVAGPAIDARIPDYLFWMEALGLMSFGTSWLAASRTLPYLTNPKERFRLTESRALEDEEPVRGR